MDSCQQLLSIYLLSTSNSDSELHLATKFIELGVSSLLRSPSDAIYILVCDVCVENVVLSV